MINELTVKFISKITSFDSSVLLRSFDVGLPLDIRYIVEQFEKTSSHSSYLFHRLSPLIWTSHDRICNFLIEIYNKQLFIISKSGKQIPTFRIYEWTMNQPNEKYNYPKILKQLLNDQHFWIEKKVKGSCARRGSEVAETSFPFHFHFPPNSSAVRCPPLIIDCASVLCTARTLYSGCGSLYILHSSFVAHYYSGCPTYSSFGIRLPGRSLTC